GDVHPALGVGDDVVHDVELASVGTRLAPGLEQLAAGGELVHPGVAVTVAHVRRGVAWHAELEEDFPLRRALAHDVAAVIGAIEDVVCVDVQAMRARERALSPRPDEVALTVEDDHRVLAAVEAVDAVLAVHRDGGHVLELPPFRQLGPVLDHAVAVLACAENGRLVPLIDAGVHGSLYHNLQCPKSGPPGPCTGSPCGRPAWRALCAFFALRAKGGMQVSGFAPSG